MIIFRRHFWRVSVLGLSWDVVVFLPRLVIRCETLGQAGVSLGLGHWSRRPFVMTRLSHQWPLIGHRLMYWSYDWCKWEKGAPYFSQSYSFIFFVVCYNFYKDILQFNNELNLCWLWNLKYLLFLKLKPQISFNFSRFAEALNGGLKLITSYKLKYILSLLQGDLFKLQNQSNSQERIERG